VAVERLAAVHEVAVLDRAFVEADVGRLLVVGQRLLGDHVLEVEALAQHP
jgi:hypothetical protein